MDIMTKEESYADRRLLFKDIWETAMQFDEKDADNIMSKPKIIKTLRLEKVDKVDKNVVSKKKKERIRNLRAVCKKILEFCNRQDAEDMFDEKRVVKKGNETDDEEQLNLKFDVKLKKGKTHRRKKKIKRAKSLFEPKKPGYQAATSEKNDYPRILRNSSRNNSPNRNKRITFSFAQRASVTPRMISKVKSNPDAQGKNSPTKGIARPSRKVMRKKRTKRKKSTTPNLNPPGPSGAPHPVCSLSQPKTGRLIVNSIKQFLTDNKIAVT